jgi:hypothetical protein
MNPDFHSFKGEHIMRKTVIFAVISAVTLLASVYAETVDDPNAAEAKRIVMEFFTKLKGELQGAIKAGGPENAIGVCKERAPAIARELSDRTDWDVGRTSLKLRNPVLNTPDEWERQVLIKFEERKASGEGVETMTYTEVVEVHGGKLYRFMKAIPTGELCLVCHGDVINPDISAAIDEAYPDDQARGFALGDIRGAFTLSKPL